MSERQYEVEMRLEEQWVEFVDSSNERGATGQRRQEHDNFWEFQDSHPAE